MDASRVTCSTFAAIVWLQHGCPNNADEIALIVLVYTGTMPDTIWEPCPIRKPCPILYPRVGRKSLNRSEHEKALNNGMAYTSIGSKRSQGDGQSYVDNPNDKLPTMELFRGNHFPCNGDENTLIVVVYTGTVPDTIWYKNGKATFFVGLRRTKARPPLEFTRTTQLLFSHNLFAAEAHSS